MKRPVPDDQLADRVVAEAERLFDANVGIMMATGPLEAYTLAFCLPLLLARPELEHEQRAIIVAIAEGLAAKLAEACREYLGTDSAMLQALEHIYGPRSRPRRRVGRA